jgi:hypothetical protein
MSTPNGHIIPLAEVEDGAAAMRKAEEFARKFLAVPKKKIDAMLAIEKSKKKKKRG